MKTFNRLARRACPSLALMFSVAVTATTMYIEEGVSPVLIFLCVQVYLNCYCIRSISKSATTMRSANRSASGVTIPINTTNTQARCKFWYCDKCRVYTYKPTQHCGICEKCFHYRDHHCYFIGGCVLRQNMGNFILICFHTSLACLYSLVTIGQRLNENINSRLDSQETDTRFAKFLNICFPVALARWLFRGEDTDIVLVTLFDALFSIFFLCLVYGAWKLYACRTGGQRYYPHVGTRQNFREIFGCYGLGNFVFPYNGLLGTRDIDGKYELKEV